MDKGIATEDRQLARDDVERLLAAGIIKENRRQELLSSFSGSIHWRSWTGLWTAAMGAIFLLAGVIFFFAWNWKEISPFQRFAILEGGVILATVGALFTGPGKAASQYLLVAASVLTGVLVAVYGQVYQTGADAFEVFALWAALMFGWVLASRFSPLWLLWLVVLQTAMATYAGQVLVPSGAVSWTTVYLAQGVFLAGFVALREWLITHDRFDWLRGEWVRVALVTSAIVWLSIIPWEAIFEFRSWRTDSAQTRVIGLLAWTVAVTGGAVFYTLVRSSLTSVGLCVISAAVIVAVWLGKILIEESSSSPVTWLMAGILAILIFSGAAALIGLSARKIAEKNNAKREEEA